jgi:hypothetical protein
MMAEDLAKHYEDGVLLYMGQVLNMIAFNNTKSDEKIEALLVEQKRLNDRAAELASITPADIIRAMHDEAIERLQEIGIDTP